MREINEEIYFTPKEAAEYFNLSLSTVKNYIYAKRLKTLKTPGGHHRIRKSELLSTMNDTETIFSRKEESFAIMEICCSALLSVFKCLGPFGDSLIEHSQNVSRICCRLSKEISLTEKETLLVKIAALLHDIGDLGIERRILIKSGPLTDEERESIKGHPRIGRDLLGSIKELRNVADIVGQHHERIDGKGYPNGLSGERIQKGARIISIAEAFDSMTSAHSYKRPVSKELAIAELVKERHTQFDGDILDTFIKII